MSETHPYDWRCEACGHRLEDPPPIGRPMPPCPNCGASRWSPTKRAVGAQQADAAGPKAP